MSYVTLHPTLPYLTLHFILPYHTLPYILPQPAKCYCFLRHASSAQPVAQKVVVRLERQVATASAYFCAATVLQ